MHLYDLDLSYSLFNHGLEIFTLPDKLSSLSGKVCVKISKPWIYGNFEPMLNKPVAHPNLSFITNQSCPTLSQDPLNLYGECGPI